MSELLNEKMLKFLEGVSKKSLDNIEEKKVLISDKQIKALLEKKREKREQGEWVGGRMPYGYNTEKRHLTIDPVEFNSLKEIIKFMKATNTIEPKEIWKHVKENEIQNRHGVTIPRPTVYRLFTPARVEIYLGEKYNFPLFTRKEIPQAVLDEYDLWKYKKNIEE